MVEAWTTIERDVQLDTKVFLWKIIGALTAALSRN